MIKVWQKRAGKHITAAALPDKEQIRQCQYTIQIYTTKIMCMCQVCVAWLYLIYPLG